MKAHGLPPFKPRATRILKTNRRNLHRVMAFFIAQTSMPLTSAPGGGRLSVPNTPGHHRRPRRGPPFPPLAQSSSRWYIERRLPPGAPFGDRYWGYRASARSASDSLECLSGADFGGFGRPTLVFGQINHVESPPIHNGPGENPNACSPAIQAHSRSFKGKG